MPSGIALSDDARGFAPVPLQECLPRVFAGTDRVRVEIGWIVSRGGGERVGTGVARVAGVAAHPASLDASRRAVQLCRSADRSMMSTSEAGLASGAFAHAA